MSNDVSITFDLPIGYEDKDGTLHKEVVMQRIKNSDIIAIQADLDLKALADKKVEVFSGNPVQQFVAAAAVAQLFAILFTRVVQRIGTIEKPDRKVFAEFFQTDFKFLRRKYCELNEITFEEGDDRPLAPGLNS